MMENYVSHMVHNYLFRKVITFFENSSEVRRS